MRSAHIVLGRVELTFDDPGAVAPAGLLLPATLAARLGIEQVLTSSSTSATGAAVPEASWSPWCTPWMLTVVYTMVAGGDCIDDVELLRCGSTGSPLGHRVMVASTAKTWAAQLHVGMSGSSTR